MDTHMKELLREIYEEGRRNDEQEQDRNKKMLNIEPETAQFISMLVRSSQRKSLLENGVAIHESLVGRSMQQKDLH